MHAGSGVHSKAGNVRPDAAVPLARASGEAGTMRKRNTEPPPTAAPANDEAFVTITELAKRWRTSRHTITAAIRAGRLQAFKVGERVYRIRESEALRYEQQQNQAAAS